MLSAAPAQGGAQPAGLEERWVDPLRKLSRLVQRLLNVVAEGLHRRGVSVRKLQADSERDQALLHAVVQSALESLALGISGNEESLSRRAQLRQFELEAVDRLPQRLDVLTLQRDPPPGRVAAVSCPSSRPAASSGPPPLCREASLPGSCLPAP